MYIAIVNKARVEAMPNMKGTCPLCSGDVFSKCGEIKEWHWAHYQGESCDSWHEPETKWHLDWKLTFGKENIEVIIKKNEKKHIADIVTKDNVVIELQNSPIQIQVVRERELFYGERMLWVINGIDFKHNFNIYEGGINPYYEFDRKMDIEAGRKITARKEFESCFSWKYARRSWKDVQRNVFIDFGDEYLFWVKGGMGLSSGHGQKILKEKFINKYGGDYKYYCQQKL